MSTFDKIVELLQKNNVVFRVVEHIPEGRTEAISKIRGNELRQGMKAMVLMVKLNKKDRKYYLAVVPGDQSLDMNAIKSYSHALGGVMFAPIDRAAALTECDMGAVPPFTFNQDLYLIVDPSIKQNKEIVFNAGVLDRSIFMKVDDYIKVVNPTFVEIIKNA
jgi:Ala-tRNA(Pro) deacylase